MTTDSNSIKPPGSSPIQLLNTVPVLQWRDRWLWDTSYVIVFALAPFVISAVLVPALLPVLGTYAFLVCLLEVIGLFFAGVFGWVGYRVRRIKAGLPKSESAMAEALIFRRPWQSPGVAVLHADRLELIPIIGKPLVAPFEDIASLSEVRWFNGRRLCWKRGFELDLKNGDRIGVAVPEPFGGRWRAFLSRGGLHEIWQGASK